MTNLEQPAEKTPAGPPGVPNDARLAFRARRNGAALGAHEIKFSRSGDQLVVDVAADYVFKLAFVTLFRYRLRAREVWNGALMQSARASTDNNGTAEFMSLERDGPAFVVEGSGARRFRAPENARIATHWNPEQLAGPMINPQNGSILRYTVSARGRAKVRDAAGRVREADHFALSGEPSPLELWYDSDGIWTSLRARATDGSSITYLAE